MKTIITTPATITSTNNVDFFRADRELSERVAEFFRCVLHKKEINLEYSSKIETLEESIENLENLAGSVMQDQIPALKTAAYNQIKALKEERTKLLEEQAKFSDTELDKNFKKVLRKNPSGDIVADEVCKWFDNYGLDIRGTLFLEEVCASFGMKIDIKTMVVTDGKSVLKLDVNNALKNMYGCAYEHMVQVGTIKPAQIPTLVREKFSKKTKKAKKTKKNA